MNEVIKNGLLAAASDAAPITISFAPEQIVDRYRKHIDHFNLSEKAKAELLLAVWHIMRNSVDRAFGDDPVQLSQKDGGKCISARETEDSPVLDSNDDPARDATSGLTNAFGQKARRQSRKGKR